MRLKSWVVDYGSNGVSGCELCGRPVARLTRHHLIPRSRHRKKRARRTFSRERMQQVALVCPACHRQIHKTLTEKELEQDYNTIESLRAQPALEKFVRWIENKPHGVVRENGRGTA
ncbi:MAG: HNH endonuclease [Rubrobacteraceae bacterium]